MILPETLESRANASEPRGSWREKHRGRQADRHKIQKRTGVSWGLGRSDSRENRESLSERRETKRRWVEKTKQICYVTNKRRS